jgi:hypothetical protein
MSSQMPLCRAAGESAAWPRESFDPTDIAIRVQAEFIALKAGQGAAAPADPQELLLIDSP